MLGSGYQSVMESELLRKGPSGSPPAAVPGGLGNGAVAAEDVEHRVADRFAGARMPEHAALWVARWALRPRPGLRGGGARQQAGAGRGRRGNWSLEP